MLFDSPFVIVSGALTGSVGKTTDTIEMVSSLARQKKLRKEKLAIIGLDENSELSDYIGLDPEEIDFSSAEIFRDNGNKDKVLQKVPKDIIGTDNVYVVPSAPDLANAILEYDGDDNLSELLSNYIETYLTKEDISVVIVDAPPSLNMLHSNCIFAGDLFVIAGRYSIKAAKAATRYVEAIKAIKGLDFENYAVLLNAVDQRNKKMNETADEIIQDFRENDEVFLTEIPIDMKVQYAQGEGKSIHVFDRSSKAAKAYDKMAIEIIRSLDL